MLRFKLTPHHAGIALWGDFDALNRLRTFITHIVEESIYIEDKEGFVLGLAYDLRKAFNGQRSKDCYTHTGGDQCQIYGVEILWPVILVQIGVLRRAMAFMPTNKLDQALMFELEYIVESALRTIIPVTADEVIHRIGCISSASYMHLDNVLESRCRYFIELPTKQRLKALPNLMETFDPMYNFWFDAGNNVKPGIISPDAFVDTEQEWPDFKW